MRTVTAVAVVASLLGFGTTAHADVVTDWNSAALSAIRTIRTSPPPASRALAMLAPFLLPQWAFVEPFAMPTSASLRPLGPPDLTSAKYTEAFDEVKALGAAVGSSRTPEQDQIALFWADGAGTETPPGHWDSIAQDVAVRFANTVEQNARLFALLNIAMADAAICAWDATYHFHNWRPITAIRNGDSDGNDSTAGDPAWTSFITTPPFPEYASGHSTFSGAASTILATFYGSDQVAFTARSNSLPGVTAAGHNANAELRPPQNGADPCGSRCSR